MIQITSQEFKDFRNEVGREFTEFRNEFKDFRNEVNVRFDKIDKRFEKVDKRFEKVEDKLDSHFETIGEVKIQVTGIEEMLRNKANHEYVKEIDERTKALERVAFA